MNAIGKKKKKGYKAAAPLVAVPPEDPKIEEAASRDISYAEGDVRRHHKYFIKSGDLFLQIQRATFKIHRHFLSEYSLIWKERLNSSSDQELGATEEHPLVLDVDDQVGAWELLFNLFYRNNPMIAVAHNGQESLEVLQVVHKYNMDVFEQTIIAHLEGASDTAEFVDLMVASNIIESKPLRDKAMKGLVASNIKPTLEEATRLGIEVCYELWNPGGIPQYGSRCRNCHYEGYLRCSQCGSNVS